jgi:hypothetical protein
MPKAHNPPSGERHPQLTRLDWREDLARIGPLWVFALDAPCSAVTKKVQRIWASSFTKPGKYMPELERLMCDYLSAEELRELAWVRFLMVGGWSEQELVALSKDYLDHSSSEIAEDTANWINQI